MSENRYLKWLASETQTTWWHDSADPDELKIGLANGACGVTTNPVLVATSLRSRPDVWTSVLSAIPKGLKGAPKAEAILERITTTIAASLLPVYQKSAGQHGYVCAQVDPSKPGDVPTMIAMARRFHAWSPNIAVKLPATASGLEALDVCTQEGITTVVTASFTVPQVLATAERHRQSCAKAKAAGKTPGKCYAVVMVGRLDDYLRDVAMDQKRDVRESDIIQSGVAVVKRAYRIFNECGYEAVLLPAAMRGPYHAVNLSGAKMVLSIHPSIQALLQPIEPTGEKGIDSPVPEETLARLRRIPEFVRAYEPDGLRPEEFITFGVTQKTLSQFVETGWKPIETYKI